jgi:hypothetical protein
MVSPYLTGMTRTVPPHLVLERRHRVSPPARPRMLGIGLSADELDGL